MRRYYPGLKADLSLVKAREFMVHVVGDVKEPGLYKSNARRRVSAIVAQAGGATGSVRRIEVRRRRGEPTVADLLLYKRTGETRYNPYLLDGDVIRVPKPGPTAAISGPLPQSRALRAGGYARPRRAHRACRRPQELRLAHASIRIVRRNRHERSTTIRLRFTAGGQAPNAPLRDDDQVIVPSTNELEQSITLVGAVTGADPADPATTIKRLQYVEGDTVRTLVERAGGVTVGADLENAYIRRDGDRLQPVDLEALLIRRDFRADRPVRMGDTIVVPFKRSSVVVEGAVVRAGSYQFNPHFGIREYLASAGGPTRYAQDADDIRLIGADGKMRSFSDDLKVRPGDTIVVPERNFSRAEIVQLVMSGAGLVLSAAALTYAVSQ